ncbi:MAG: DUF2970 domain-containing protein [Gammaproteobacteria bacterium]
MNEEHKKAPTLMDVTRSVLWGMLGVQKKKNYERDFTKGKPWQYVVIGLVAVSIFIISIVVVVNLVLSSAGS